jgi:hypothetical protein
MRCLKKPFVTMPWGDHRHFNDFLDSDTPKNLVEDCQYSVCPTTDSTAGMYRKFTKSEKKT